MFKYVYSEGKKPDVPVTVLTPDDDKLRNQIFDSVDNKAGGIPISLPIIINTDDEQIVAEVNLN